MADDEKKANDRIARTLARLRSDRNEPVTAMSKADMLRLGRMLTAVADGLDLPYLPGELHEAMYDSLDFFDHDSFVLGFGWALRLLADDAPALRDSLYDWLLEVEEALDDTDGADWDRPAEGEPSGAAPGWVIGKPPGDAGE